MAVADRVVVQRPVPPRMAPRRNKEKVVHEHFTESHVRQALAFLAECAPLVRAAATQRSGKRKQKGELVIKIDPTDSGVVWVTVRCKSRHRASFPWHPSFEQKLTRPQIRHLACGSPSLNGLAPLSQVVELLYKAKLV